MSPSGDVRPGPDMPATDHRQRHHEHRHDASGFVGAVASACELRGLRLTPLRLRVLELIAAESKPVKAYDIPRAAE